MKEKIADHISGKLGMPDLVELLAERMTGYWNRSYGPCVIGRVVGLSPWNYHPLRNGGAVR